MAAGLSELPEKKHPWAKYYAERGLSRPPMADLARLPAGRKARGNDPAKSAPKMSAELAEIVAAVTATKPDTTATPFITVMQKQAVAREVRRRARWRFARFGLALVAVALGLHIAVTRFFHRAPAAEALDDYGLVLATDVLPLYSSLHQPLQIDRATIEFSEKVGAQHLRYVAEVTLRLRQPLYVPANTNGTEAYRRLQQSLQTARSEELKFKLFSAVDAPPEAPELPLLLQMSHRAGEAFVVRVPFEAKRAGWRWRIEPPLLALRSVATPFNGAALVRYAGSPYLIFGTSETRAEIRQRERLARDYIIAVTKQVQKRADFEAVVETPPASSALEMLSIADEPPAAVAPEEVALPATAHQPAIDPDAPAIELPPESAPRLKAAPPPIVSRR